MSCTKVPALNALLTAYLALVAISLSGFLSSFLELWALRFASIIFTAVHLHYGICVVIINSKNKYRVAEKSVPTFIFILLIFIHSWDY
jgi:hypothetical protein